MGDLFRSTVIADIALAVLAIEALLVVSGARRWRPLDRTAYAANVVAGAGLLLAFRALAGGAHWVMTAGALLLALVGHCVDLYRRLNQSSDGQ